jgi:hypothetical protein
VLWHVIGERSTPKVDWQSIDTAPFGQDLQLSVIENGEVHALIFPCRRAEGGWLRGLTKQLVSIRPTHWRLWQAACAVKHTVNAFE